MLLRHFAAVSLLLPMTVAMVVDLSNHFDGGFQGEACIPVTKELDGWKARLTFDADVASVEVPVADVVKVSAREYILTSRSENAVQHVGDRLCFTFIGHGDGDIAPLTQVYIEGMNDPPGTSGPPVTSGPATAQPTGSTGGSDSPKNYTEALGYSILFFDAQRSGKLPANNPIKWRGDSALNDCVPGGWYDAGDHVKFGLPMSSSTTLLAWGLNMFKDGYVKAGQLDMMYDMIKWPLDYFLKAWDPNKKELVVQVGDGNLDHRFWGRPEDMTMARPCKTVNASVPGSDIAGGTAAAMAAGSLAFKDKGDTAYANELLTAAQSLYAFAKANRGTFTGSKPFYTSGPDKDELCEAAVWLHRATGDSQYLDDAKGFVDTYWGWALSWGDKSVACQQLLWEETGDASYKALVESYMNDWLPGGQITYTPCGQAWRDKWGSNRYAGNSAFLALVAAEKGLHTLEYRTWAVEQINYLLGDNPHDGGCFSYLIGYGSKFPRQPHHRGASCPDMPAPCGQPQFTAPGPSPQILVGGLVGGPDASDRYEDKRGDYVQNEVATDYNSGFHSALAGIVHLRATDNLPVTNNKCPCKS